MKTVEVLSSASNRRAFFKGAGMAGLGLASAAVTASKLAAPKQRVEAAAISDVDILNFALNLEYLEAEFYSMAVLGKTLVQLGVLTTAQTSGPTTGGAQITALANSPLTKSLSNGLQSNEKDHVGLLRGALGSMAVLKPAINLDALGYGFASVNDFYKLARQLEEVGTSAYLGAAPLISSDSYLATAGSILSVEAKHTGALRLLCIQNGVTSPAVDSLDVPPDAAHPFDNVRQGLTAPRTPAQVLNIVYGGGTTSGGFYPSGLNGNIK